MRKSWMWVPLLTVALSIIFLNGCALDKTFVKKDMASLGPMKVVRHEPPGFEVQTGGGMFLIALGGCVTAPAGAYIIHQRSKEIRPHLPDFTELVMNSFVEKAGKEIAGWPQVSIEPAPVKKDYKYTEGSLLEFKLINIYAVHFVMGFITETRVTMKDANGDVIWRKSFSYKSRSLDRKKSIDEFTAEQGKLLKEEMVFAADYTAMDFIKHFKQ